MITSLSAIVPKETQSQHHFLRSAWFAAAIAFLALAWPALVQADACEDLADRTIHDVLADEDLSRLSTAGRANLLYGLAYTSPNEFERVARSPDTSSLFRTPEVQLCERSLRLLSRLFAPRPGDEKELAEILAGRGLDPSVARDSVRGNRELAGMAEGSANLILIAQRMATGRPLEPELLSTWSGLNQVASFSRGMLCNQVAGTPLGLAETLFSRTMIDMLQKLMQQSNVMTSLVCR